MSASATKGGHNQRCFVVMTKWMWAALGRLHKTVQLSVSNWYSVVLCTGRQGHQQHFKLHVCIVWNGHNTVSGFKCSVICV